MIDIFQNIKDLFLTMIDIFLDKTILPPIIREN